MNKAVKISIISAVAIAVLGVGALFARPLFIKAKVARTADELARAIETGDAQDISSLTDKSDKEVIEELKLNLKGEMYSEEENIYAASVRDTIVCKVDKGSVELQDSTHASCAINVSMADFELLKDDTYDSISELTDLVKDLDKVEFTYNVNFIKKDGRWLVTNIDSSGFARIFSYRNIDLQIGLPSLTETAGAISELIPCLDSNAGVVKSSEYNQELYDLIDGYAKASDPDQQRFTDAVRGLITCSANSDEIYITGRDGFAGITVNIPDYEQLSSQRFSNIDEAILALGSLGTKEITLSLEFTRDDEGIWKLTNPEAFADVFLFKDFSINTANLDGNYSSYVDITSQINNIMASETGAGSRIYENTQGEVLLRVYLNLDGSSYSYGADEDFVASSVMDYFTANIDTIAKNYLGTDNQTVLDTLSALAGYRDYADLKTDVLGRLSDMTKDIYFGSIASSGEYKISGNNIIFLGEDLYSTDDDITGEVDAIGRIHVILPITDPDVAELFGSDQIDLLFVKDTE